VIDDERLARVGLRRLLQAHPDITIVGEANNGQDAANKIRRMQPDFLFLDVEMPGQNGLDLLEELEDVPPVIFTTAFEEYAVRAFEVSALDYLVKPIVPERLARALDKVRKTIAETEKQPDRKRQVFLRDGKRCWIVMVDQIRRLESVGNYTRVYFGDNAPLISKSLNALEARLDPALFFRASRSHMINLREVRSIDEEANGGLIAVLTDGHRILITRRQSHRLRELLSL
jgi:two-component system LytT family response regulator